MDINICFSYIGRKLRHISSENCHAIVAFYLINRRYTSGLFCALFLLKYLFIPVFFFCFPITIPIKLISKYQVIMKWLFNQMKRVFFFLFKSKDRWMSRFYHNAAAVQGLVGKCSPALCRSLVCSGHFFFWKNTWLYSTLPAWPLVVNWLGAEGGENQGSGLCFASRSMQFLLTFWLRFLCASLVASNSVISHPRIDHPCGYLRRSTELNAAQIRHLCFNHNMTALLFSLNLHLPQCSTLWPPYMNHRLLWVLCRLH